MLVITLNKTPLPLSLSPPGPPYSPPTFKRTNDQYLSQLKIDVLERFVMKLSGHIQLDIMKNMIIRTISLLV